MIGFGGPCWFSSNQMQGFMWGQLLLLWIRNVLIHLVIIMIGYHLRQHNDEISFGQVCGGQPEKISFGKITEMCCSFIIRNIQKTMKQPTPSPNVGIIFPMQWHEHPTTITDTNPTNASALLAVVLKKKYWRVTVVPERKAFSRDYIFVQSLASYNCCIQHHWHHHHCLSWVIALLLHHRRPI